MLSFQPMMILFSILGQACSFIFFNLKHLDVIWFSIIVVLLYIGGVLMVFLYLNSVSTKMVLKNNFNLMIFLFLSFFLLDSMKNYNFFFSDYMLMQSFYSLKELFFLGFIIYLFIFIYLINNLLNNTKSPLNVNM